jgi:acetoin utilization deacetylase AcuC-like enzyme
VRVFYDPAYVGASHAFDTTRKARWVADSLGSEPIPDVELTSPRSLTWDEVARVHDPVYVDAVRTGEPRGLAQSQGFSWDPGLGTMVLSSNGGVVAAALEALKDGVAGSLSSGMHHAHRDHGGGFCTFNGLVLAARAARKAGAASVLIVDFDAHCGGGTASLIGGDPYVRQVDVVVDPSFDHYRGTEAARVAFVRRADEYLSAIDQALDDAASTGVPHGLCLYNAGMDPHEDCAIGGLPGITAEVLAERERRLFAWCRSRSIPAAFVLAGGYIGPSLDERGLVRLHRLTVSAASSSAAVRRPSTRPGACRPHGRSPNSNL